MLVKIATFALISAAITLLVAVLLVASQRPTAPLTQAGLKFVERSDPQPLSPLDQFQARDGATLGYRIAGSEDAAPVVLIHGSSWHGGAYMSLAEGIAAQGFRVIVPDLRGHGPLADPRGDVAYIGQLEDDLADLLDHLGLQSAAFVGHSSGGGLVLRLAGGAYGDRIDSAALIAPFLKYNAPTARADTGGWTQVLTRRMIGLSMLNLAKIRVLNHLTVIQFSLPPEVRATPQGQVATDAYSYRMNTSFSPRMDYAADIAALPRFLLLAGAQDEAFLADQYEPTMAAISQNGTYRLLPGLGHLDILEDPEAATVIADFLKN